MNTTAQNNTVELFHDMNKLFSIIKSSMTTEHLDVCQRMLYNFGRKWDLLDKDKNNPIYDSIFNQIMNLRSALIDSDYNASEINEIQ